MMSGIECKSGDIASAISAACFDNGMIIETAGPDDEVVKFFCPLTISESELEKGLSIFDKAAEKIAEKTLKKAS
jgi:diaminobutyrate-2-oxoglutarate transaminase